MIQNSNNLNADQKELIKNLSVRLIKGNTPFVLGPEGDFGPADWAWQFLRLNKEYETAYLNAKAQAHTRKQKERHFTDGTLHSSRREPTKSLLESEAVCRNKFGLSTWLDPKNKTLPDIDDLGREPWFFPLTMVDPIFPGSLAPPFSPNLFSYGAPPPSSTHRRALHQSAFEGYPPILWFVIDCAIPIESQIAGIRAFARPYAYWLKSYCASSTDTAFESQSLTLEEYGERHGRVKKPVAIAGASAIDKEQAVNQLRYKRVILVDALGPIVRQLKNYLPALQREYKRLCAGGVATTPFRQRRPKDFTKSQRSITFTDGNIYKAMAVVAQLRNQGLDSSKIDELLWKHSEQKDEKGDPWRPWIADREDRIKSYAEMADQFIDDGYRWIVQGQKVA